MTDHEGLIHEERRLAREVVEAAERFVDRASYLDRFPAPSFWELRATLLQYREARSRAMRETTS